MLKKYELWGLRQSFLQYYGKVESSYRKNNNKEPLPFYQV
jgi:hypothetical protein